MTQAHGGLRRAGTVAATLGLAVTGLVACGGPPAAEVHRGDVLAVEAGSITAVDVGRSQWLFGMDLLHVVCAQDPRENVLLSPTSAAEALGLLLPAAGGVTATGLADLHHVPSWSTALRAATRAYPAALAALGPEDGDSEERDTLRMSNRVWTASGLEPRQEYLDDVATAFDADVRSLDFAGDPQGATDRINATVDEDTGGLIPTLFDAPLPDLTQAVLTNALHLDAAWLTPFTESAPGAFHGEQGDTTVDLMRGSSGRATAADGWLRVELPYRDGTLTAAAVLPPEGADPCGVDAAVLDALSDPAPTEVAVVLPRVRLEQTHDLLDLLAGLGLPVSGDYSGLGRPDLAVSAVVQKTYLDVDEAGTEAAAATGEAMAGSAPGVPEVVVVDRPFLFLVTDTATSSPLFVTVIRDLPRAGG